VRLVYFPALDPASATAFRVPEPDGRPTIKLSDLMNDQRTLPLFRILVGPCVNQDAIRDRFQPKHVQDVDLF
jgi:hypothetical protein